MFILRAAKNMTLVSPASFTGSDRDSSSYRALRPRPKGIAHDTFVFFVTCVLGTGVFAYMFVRSRLRTWGYCGQHMQPLRFFMSSSE
ncbi:hypothetical protein PG985_002924 [Apiospora marii]|uniref:uncharacterized protein n=1 Tax=Apiospora marii TaxID=335849 RepID=UPI00312E4FC6